MLIIRLGKIIEFANLNQTWLKKAVEEFFGKNTDIDKYDPNILSGLFNEWFIFDFQPSKQEATPVNQYYLKNPDLLSIGPLEELEQIIKTQIYSMFQIEEIKRGEWLLLKDIFSGKDYRIYDIKGSSNSNDKGTLSARVACVDNKWRIVGSDPLYFPMAYTKRALKILTKIEKTPNLNPKFVFDHFIKNQRDEKPKPDENIADKRHLLEQEFNKLKEKYKFGIKFEEIRNFVFKENYKDHFAQFFKDLSVELKIPEKAIFDNLWIFQDIWNYFPHKALNGLCPNEMYRKYGSS